MSRHSLLLLLVLIPSLLTAQDSISFTRDVELAKHLIGLNDHEDAFFLLDKYDGAGLKKLQLDSLYFYKGLSQHLNASSIDAVGYFEKVTLRSSFYHQSKYLQAFDHLLLHQYDSSKVVLSVIDNKGSMLLEELRSVELAGISLLQRDQDAFLEHSSRFSYTYPALAKEQKNLVRYSAERHKIKKKSPAVAGMLSAVVPGCGKLYAGRHAEAAAAFLQLALLGGMAYESYKVIGPKSPQFIIFGGLFTIFYAGNIYGSAISIKVKREELLHEIDNQIVVDLQLPLGRIFK